MNNIVLLGNIASDIELRTTTTGKSVASFRIAVNRDYGDGCDFIPCVAWEKTADNIERYFNKGKRIAVQGRLQTREYEDKSGMKRTVYEVIVERFDFCEKKETDFYEVGADLPL